MFCPEWMEWWPNKPRIGPQLPESAIITCKSGGYLPVGGGQLALVLAKVTTMNHCGQNTVYGTYVLFRASRFPWVARWEMVDTVSKLSQSSEQILQLVTPHLLRLLGSCEVT